MQAHINFVDTDVWQLSGELGFYSVNSLLTEFTQYYEAAQQPPKVLDLSGVTRTDSAGLAVLLAFRQRTHHQPVEFRDIPVQMLRIAELSGVKDLLVGE